MNGIYDAASFYGIIKQNTLYAKLEDAEAIAALDDYFLARFKLSNAENLMGVKRDRFMFFQGMLAGCLVQSKIYRHHLAATAAEQNVNVSTGEAHGSDSDN